MIEINLFPDKNFKLLIKKNFQIQLPEISASRIMLGTLLVVLIVHLALSTIIELEKREIKKIEDQLALKGVDTIAVNNQKEENKVLEAEVERFEKITKGDFLLAQKLNVLSDLLPKYVWLINIDLQSDALRLSGTEIMKGQREVQIWDLIHALKNNKVFFEGFEDIKLSYTKRKRMGKAEVVDFMMLCPRSRRQEGN
ncbi:MAG: hypothetical protein JW844_05725 [Candidatus Omnitrophica bacterium]|nr:hypothetical protein [Candidatus Omnitrophota bacterium]